MRYALTFEFVVSAVLVHFAFLATFTWLNVLSFDIWWTFKYVVPIKLG